MCTKHLSVIHPVVQGVILPNGIVEINFTIFIDNTEAAKLNLAEKVVKNTVILHSMLGKDHFISITGEYRTSLTHLERENAVNLPSRIHLFCNITYKVDTSD